MSSASPFWNRRRPSSTEMSPVIAMAVVLVAVQSLTSAFAIREIATRLRLNKIHTRIDQFPGLWDSGNHEGHAISLSHQV